jgi:hypothetical protein
MKSNNLSQFRLIFSADSTTDDYMNLAVSVDGQSKFGPAVCDKRLVVEFESTLPCQIQIDVSGKNYLNTQIDENGNIVKDTYIRLDSVFIDRMPIKKWFLESKFLKFYTENQTLTSNYFGFNGRAVVDISYADSFTYLLSLQESQ